MNKPNSTSGVRHVALFVQNLEDCVKFYVDLLDMKIEWQPDADNVYLTSGFDNLALHRAPDNLHTGRPQRLDHIGFILNAIDDVDEWHTYFKAHDIKILAAPKTHRDGARSFYCKDPSDNVVQMIYHPPLANPQ